MNKRNLFTCLLLVYHLFETVEERESQPHEVKSVAKGTNSVIRLKCIFNTDDVI